MKEKCNRILWALGLDDVYKYRHETDKRVVYKACYEWLHFYKDGRVSTQGGSDKPVLYPDIWAFVREIALQ